MAIAETQERHYVVFGIAGRRCALVREAVRGLLPLPNLWRPPGTPQILAGFVNVAGDAVAVLDLKRLFGLAADVSDKESEFYRHLILVDGVLSDRPVALLVDRVQAVTRLPDDVLQPLTGDASQNGVLEAEAAVDGELVHILSLSRLLLDAERAGLADLEREAAARIGEWAGAS
ncbi:chemotaxis protein CheW [Lacibacterium aquatile]|uniref:Chemotaxis protein CheW n=1 Tax=Lacibacterium aquatile TaxID=1168082 RepID=A0ABW5DPE4_9PROT